MKKPCIPFVIALLFLISSCNKDEPTPIPSPPKQDTLTAGWKKIIIDSSKANTDIFFKNNTTGYLVGEDTYKSTNGGLNWNLISNQSFNNIAVTSNGNAFFADMTDLFKLANGSGPLSKVNIVFFQISPVEIADVFFIDDNNGFYFAGGALFNTTDGGTNWTQLALAGFKSVWEASPIFFINNNTGWITSDKEIYKTDGSPSKWVAATFTDKSPTSRLTSVFAIPDNTVYTIAFSGELYKSTNGGGSFSLIHTFEPVASYWGDIHFVDNATGYVCRGNKIYKTTDAGNTWAVVVTLGNGELVELHFTDVHHGWACGDKGTVLIYND